MHKIIKFIVGLPKTLYVNFCSCPIYQAVKLPIWVNHRTKFKSLKGKIIFTKPVHSGMLKIGFGGSGTASFLPVVIENHGTIYCGENVSFGGGCQVCTVSNESILKIDSDVSFTGECHIVAADNIFVGKGSLISWNTQIMDTDFHKIIDNNKEIIINRSQAIEIGANVWICSRVNILKGTVISDNSVIASDSLLTGCILDKENSVYTGMPVKIIKKDISWKI